MNLTLTCSRLKAYFSTHCLRRSVSQAEYKTRMSVQQPPWKLLERKVDEPVLKIYNSLTRTKVSSDSCHIEGIFHLLL